MVQQKNQNKQRRSRRKTRSNPLVWFAVMFGGIVLLLWGAYTLWESRQSGSVKVPVEVKGAPSLVVDQELVDLGDVPMNKMVTVSFKLTNVGDKPLQFSESPYIEVLEGC